MALPKSYCPYFYERALDTRQSDIWTLWPKWPTKKVFDGFVYQRSQSSHLKIEGRQTHVIYMYGGLGKYLRWKISGELTMLGLAIRAIPNPS